MTTLRAVPLGCGHYLPDRVVPNDEFAGWLDTSDEWIRARTGIITRRFAADGETTADLAAAAAQAALQSASADPADVDAIILATATPTVPFLRPRRGCSIC
jgi:3-oxoacyl-[acyl-carrier-protein] synthase-3